MEHLATYLIILVFLAGLVGISWASRRSDSGHGNADSAENYIVGGRSIGTGVLLLSMGATYFSTWTLLGSFGSYYRSGIWFSGFAVWTIFHGIFVWLFGVRIWMSGKRFSFLTPGQMMEHYYDSRRLRTLVAIVGVLALIPVMLIQITGAALALESITSGAIPYWLGVSVTSIMVGAMVLWAGFKGTAWGDTFMGLFFAVIMIGTAVYVVSLAGGLEMFKNVQQHKPELLVNPGNALRMAELWLGLGFGAWALPHMWQKYYSADSQEVLGKVAMATPFWNSWLMALVPLLVGIAVVIPGIAPTVTVETSDTILPQLFASRAPLIGALVVAGILAAGISTINSQLLSAASIVAFDIYGVNRQHELNGADVTRVTRVVVVIVTILLFVLAMTPGGAGYLVPVASLGFSFGLQLVPSALGALYFRGITEKGAFFGLLSGAIAMGVLAAMKLDMPIGPGLAGFFINIFVTVVVSRFTPKVSDRAISEYHDMYNEYLVDNIDSRSMQRT